MPQEIVADIVTWASNAERGARCVYFHGNLGEARQIAAQCGRHALDAETVHALGQAQDAWALHMNRRVTLVQKRTGFDSVDYIAVKTRAR